MTLYIGTISSKNKENRNQFNSNPMNRSEEISVKTDKSNSSLSKTEIENMILSVEENALKQQRILREDERAKVAAAKEESLIADAEFEKDMGRFKKNINFFVSDTQLRMKKVQSILKSIEQSIKDKNYEESTVEKKYETIFSTLKNNNKVIQDNTKYLENEVKNLRVISEKKKINLLKNIPSRRGYIVD